MTSSGSTIGGTLTGGIQDIAALLPLLGTEQCEEQIGSVLTIGKDFLFVAATPISIFGSLGLAMAGFKAFVAAIFIPRLGIDGARFLANAGFQPKGDTLPLIMLDKGTKSHLTDKRLQDMMYKLHIDDSSKVTISESPETWSWNVKMILCTAISSIISITPYIHLNLHNNRLNHFARWGFPVSRAIGGFLTATMIQLLIQSRLLEIMKKRLILNGLDKAKLQGIGVCGDETLDRDWTRSSFDQRCFILLAKLALLNKSTSHPPTASPTLNPNNDANCESSLPTLPPPIAPDRTQAGSSTHSGSYGIKDVPRDASSDLEKGVAEAAAETQGELQERIVESYGNSVLRVMTLLLLLIGIIASVAGYIGCFSVVQGAESSGEALIWVCLEAGLSVLRIILWGCNPPQDDAPPLELKLKLDEQSPALTCTMSAEQIKHDKILPLICAPEFLEMITSYTGLLEQFRDPTQALTLYYTLTRRDKTFKAGSHITSGKSSADSEPELGDRVLYITLYNHTERTTRVYAEDLDIDDGARDSEMSNFYSADELTVDPEHGILQTKIGRQIKQKEDDPIAGNADLQKIIQAHYQSILNQLNYGIAPPSDPNYDVLEDDWTLKFRGESAMQKAGKSTRRGNENLDEDSGRISDDNAHLYLKQELQGRKVRALIRVRGKWIKDYMEWLYSDIDRMFAEVEGLETAGGKERNVVLSLVTREQEEMEEILVDGWENKLRKAFEELVQLNAGLPEQSTLERIWRASSWERLEEGRMAMEARINEVESSFLRRVADAGKDSEGAQSSCKDRIKRTWSTLLASNPAAASSSYRPTLSERLELILKDSRDREWEDDMGIGFGSTPSKKAGSRYFEGLHKMETRLRREVKSVEDRGLRLVNPGVAKNSSSAPTLTPNGYSTHHRTSRMPMMTPCDEHSKTTTRRCLCP